MTWRHGRGWIAVGLAAACFPVWGAAQAPAPTRPTQAPADSSAPNAETAQALAHDLIRTLQGVRVLAQPPVVPQTGQVPRVDGRTAVVPVTAALGFSDLRLYRYQLESVFPVSQDYYPMDSIDGIRAHRAADWITRLSTVPVTERTYATLGWEQIPFAEIAAQAANDAIAQRLFDARIAELAKDPAQQSYALFETIATLANPTQDSARLAHNVALAETYLTRLHALPASGYKTRNDSTSVLERQWHAEDTLAVAYGALGDSARVLGHARKALTYIPQLGIHERAYPLALTHIDVAKALMQTPEGRTQILAFHAPLLAMAHRAATEAPADTPPEQRARMQGIETEVQRRVEGLTIWLARLNTPAHELTGHLWLNTPDSLYAATPRARSLADGTVRVLTFGNLYDNGKLSVFNRMQHRFPSGVELVFVTTTSGSAGPDIVGPKDEADYLTRYFHGLRHLGMPIAIWAPEKEQVGYVPEGHYPVFRPKETPNEKPYDNAWLPCTLIDKRGIIRFYQDIETRRDEAVLQKRIQLLLDEPGPAPASGAATSGTAAPRAAQSPQVSAAPAAVASSSISSVDRHGTH